MVLLALMIAVCMVAVVVSSVLGLIAGTAIDLNAILGAMVFVVGSIAMAAFVLANGDEARDSV
ncbi:MAG: hypothetical protein NVS2B16_14880 [Chloroflexota bacterium]